MGEQFLHVWKSHCPGVVTFAVSSSLVLASFQHVINFSSATWVANPAIVPTVKMPLATIFISSPSKTPL
jgi:hypothetical protein